jgi:hypothetical protein
VPRPNSVGFPSQEHVLTVGEYLQVATYVPNFYSCSLRFLTRIKGFYHAEYVKASLFQVLSEYVVVCARPLPAFSDAVYVVFHVCFLSLLPPLFMILHFSFIRSFLPKSRRVSVAIHSL